VYFIDFICILIGVFANIVQSNQTIRS